MSFAERMRDRRRELGMTRPELAKRLNVSASAISNYENAVSAPKEDILLRLFDALDVEPNYLFQDSFTARSSTMTPNEIKLIERYRGLTAKGRQAIAAVLDVAEEKHSGKVHRLELPRPVRQIPLFVSPAAAGYVSPVLGEEYEMIDVDTTDRAQFAVRISGDSMEPYIHDGSIVYVTREPLQNGDIGVFCVDNDTFCKQYYKDPLGMVYLFSLNRSRADADVVLPPSSGRSLNCFGKVLIKGYFPLPEGAR